MSVVSMFMIIRAEQGLSGTLKRLVFCALTVKTNSDKPHKSRRCNLRFMASMAETDLARVVAVSDKGHYINNESAATPGLHLESDKIT